MAFSLLWSLGLIVSIIIFAIDMALIFSFKDISKKSLMIFSIISFFSTLILVYFIDLFKTQLISAIGLYNYLLLFLISFILIFIGYFHICCGIGHVRCICGRNAYQKNHNH